MTLPDGSRPPGTQETFDQDGNITSQEQDPDAVNAWDDSWFSAVAGTIQMMDLPRINTAFSFNAVHKGNKTSAKNRTNVAIRSIRFQKQIVFDSGSGTVNNFGNLSLDGIALNKTETAQLVKTPPRAASQITLTINDSGNEGSAVFVADATTDYTVSADGKTVQKQIGPGHSTTVKIKGAIVSQKDKNINVIATSPKKTTLGNQKFSVVSVSWIMRSQNTDQTEDNDKGAGQFAKDMGQPLGSRPHLGRIIVPFTNSSGLPMSNFGCSLGAEFVGKIGRAHV